MSSESNRRRTKDITGKRFTRLTAVSYSSEEVKWTCKCDCGNTVKVRVALLNNGNTKSCGCLKKTVMAKVAKDKHRSTRVAAGRCPNIPLTPEDKLARHAFTGLGKVILERDDYTCAWCSTRGCELHVHHIDTWANSPLRRFDRTNLATLCKPCHAKVHRGDFSVLPDPYMSILLEGYAKEMEAT